MEEELQSLKREIVVLKDFLDQSNDMRKCKHKYCPNPVDRKEKHYKISFSTYCSECQEIVSQIAYLSETSKISYDSIVVYKKQIYHRRGYTTDWLEPIGVSRDDFYSLKINMSDVDLSQLRLATKEELEKLLPK